MPDPLDPGAFDDATLEQLNAYLDGELDQRAKLAFEERLVREPELRKLFDGMRNVDSELTASLGAVPQMPPSEALLASVKAFAAAQAGDTAERGGNVVAFESRRKPQAAEARSWRLPIAAGVALCIGAGGMWMARSLQDGQVQVATVSISEGVVVKGGPLHMALELAASGEVQPAGDEKVRPILSFVAKDGRFCREFESFGAKGSVVGVACKGDRGWTMEALLSAAAHLPNETQYAPASGFNAKALDDVVSELIDGEPMTVEAEAAARGDGWQKRTSPSP